MPDLPGRALRPLDRIRSIKVKLGVLVAASVAATALLLWYGLVELGVRPRYTVPVSVVLALAVTQVLAHGMTSPLRELTAAARAMAGGDYTRRVRATSRDEVGEAARAFNRMAEDLGAVDRQRRELVANVSHELRTPIAALRAVLENLVDGVTPPDRATLTTALEQTERLGRLVSELLDLSRIDAGIATLTPSRTDVAALFDAAVREAVMVGRPVSFAIDVEPPGLAAWGDPARLRQLVANLLDNAAKHSPAGGRITLSARPTPSGVRLEVTDEGPGIPLPQREQMFERFTRGCVDVGNGGTGLGLAIARWVVDLHGGSIAVVDTSPAPADPSRTGGCRIRVDLPHRKDVPA